MIHIQKKTLEDLEFPAVLYQLSERCITEKGKEQVAKISPYRSVKKIVPELTRVKEISASFNSDAPMPNHGFDSLDKELQFLGLENSTLDISGFRRIVSISQTTRNLLLFFDKYKEFYVALHTFSETIQYISVIEEAILAVVDRYGEIKNDASDELFNIRKRLSHVKGQINASFGRALSRYASQDLLDTIRESIVDNRRVLAVKAMHRKKIKGAVLGTSKTGSIVYIEPQETLEYANELTSLLVEELEEIKRILLALTNTIRPHIATLKSYQLYLTSIDVMYAKAKYGVSINGCVPILTKKRKLDLQKAFHPLLYVANKSKKEKTYPQNISLHLKERIIVISGPNAGGKSITLKTVGLLQVMLQSGMLVPVDPLSEFCFFDTILTDIGDNQSIENHLSTYSYRLKKMNQFLRKCSNNTLFLIDEFGTGSDPDLGGALAETFLEVFYEREAFGIITTHYSNLKLLANELPFAINANMQFDRKTLEPLYQLQLGEAGSSFTFEVAQKNGIPYSLINKSKKKIERGKVRFDKTIANLQKERLDLRKTSASLKTEEEKAKIENKQLEQVNKKVQEKLERYQEVFDANQKSISLGKKVEQIADIYFTNKKKKVMIDELVKLVMIENSKKKKLTPKVKKAKKQKEKEVLKVLTKEVEVIRETKKKEKEALKKTPAPKPRVALKVGDRVRMIDGRAIGTIDSIEKEKAIVNYGIFTTNVNMKELEKV